MQHSWRQTTLTVLGLAVFVWPVNAVVIARPSPYSMDRVVQNPENQAAIAACLSVHPGATSRAGMGTPFLMDVQVLLPRRGVDPVLLQVVSGDMDGRRRVCTVERDNPQKLNIQVVLDNVVNVFVAAETWPHPANRPPKGQCMNVIPVVHRAGPVRRVRGWLLEKDARFRCLNADWLAPLRTPDF